MTEDKGGVQQATAEGKEYYVWVKASEELPDFKFMRSIEVRDIKTKEKFTAKFDPLNKSFADCLINEIEWLKPIIIGQGNSDAAPESDFSIANDMDFYDACLDFYDSKKPLQRNPVQTVGDRMRLIKCLREKGFTIKRKVKADAAPDGWMWTDELVKEMIWSKLPVPEHYYGNVQKCLDEFKQSKKGTDT